MENMMQTGAVVFVATLAANLAWTLLWPWLTRQRSAVDLASPGKSTIRRPVPVVVLSGAVMLMMIIHVMNAVSTGDMAAGIGAIAIVVTALTVLAVGRGLRR